MSAGNGRRRLRVQIYVDVLRSIHARRSQGQAFCRYPIERDSRLTYPRLEACLRELREAGLIDASGEITDRGYAFLSDVTAKVAPVLEKYGLWGDMG